MKHNLVQIVYLLTNNNNKLDRILYYIQNGSTSGGVGVPPTGGS